jgi:hypothetical protein
MTDISSGSEKIITPEEKWVEEHFQSFQWTARDQFVSAKDLDVGTSCAMDSPPDAHSDGADDPGGFDEDHEESEEEHRE